MHRKSHTRSIFAQAGSETIFNKEKLDKKEYKPSSRVPKLTIQTDAEVDPTIVTPKAPKMKYRTLKDTLQVPQQSEKLLSNARPHETQLFKRETILRQGAKRILDPIQKPTSGLRKV